MYRVLCVKYPLNLPDFNEIEFSRQTLKKKYSNIKFHENQSSGRRVHPCGQTDRLTDMTLIVVFSYYANAPNEMHNDTMYY